MLGTFLKLSKRKNRMSAWQMAEYFDVPRNTAVFWVRDLLSVPDNVLDHFNLLSPKFVTPAHLKAFLLYMDFTWSEAAAEFGVEDSLWLDWLNGKKLPPSDLWPRMLSMCREECMEGVGLGRMINRERRKRCMTLEQVAKLFGVSVSTAYYWEHGHHAIPEKVLKYFSVCAPSVATPKHLKLFRQALHLNQTEAAKLVGKSLSTWHHWEKGDRPIPRYLLFTLKPLVEAYKAEKEGVETFGMKSITAIKHRRTGIGGTIRDLRKKYGLTQEHAAEFFGVSQPLWSLWETGLRKPPVEACEEEAFVRKLMEMQGKIENIRFENVKRADVVRQLVSWSLKSFRMEFTPVMPPALAGFLYNQARSDDQWCRWEAGEIDSGGKILPSDLMHRLEQIREEESFEFLCWASSIWPVEKLPEEFWQYKGMLIPELRRAKKTVKIQQKRGLYSYFNGQVSKYVCDRLIEGIPVDTRKYAPEIFGLLRELWRLK